MADDEGRGPVPPDRPPSRPPQFTDRETLHNAREFSRSLEDITDREADVLEMLQKMEEHIGVSVDNTEDFIKALEGSHDILDRIQTVMKAINNTEEEHLKALESGVVAQTAYEFHTKKIVKLTAEQAKLLKKKAQLEKEGLNHTKEYAKTLKEISKKNKEIEKTTESRTRTLEAIQNFEKNTLSFLKELILRWATYGGIAATVYEGLEKADRNLVRGAEIWRARLADNIDGLKKNASAIKDYQSQVNKAILSTELAVSKLGVTGDEVYDIWVRMSEGLRGAWNLKDLKRYSKGVVSLSHLMGVSYSEVVDSWTEQTQVLGVSTKKAGDNLASFYSIALDVAKAVGKNRIQVQDLARKFMDLAKSTGMYSLSLKDVASVVGTITKGLMKMGMSSREALSSAESFMGVLAKPPEWIEYQATGRFMKKVEDLWGASKERVQTALKERAPELGDKAIERLTSFLHTGQGLTQFEKRKGVYSLAGGSKFLLRDVFNTMGKYTWNRKEAQGSLAVLSQMTGGYESATRLWSLMRERKAEGKNLTYDEFVKEFEKVSKPKDTLEGLQRINKTLIEGIGQGKESLKNKFTRLWEAFQRVIADKGEILIEILRSGVNILTSLFNSPLVQGAMGLLAQIGGVVLAGYGLFKLLKGTYYVFVTRSLGAITALLRDISIKIGMGGGGGGSGGGTPSPGGLRGTGSLAMRAVKGITTAGITYSMVEGGKSLTGIKDQDTGNRVTDFVMNNADSATMAGAAGLYAAGLISGPQALVAGSFGAGFLAGKILRQKTGLGNWLDKKALSLKRSNALDDIKELAKKLKNTKDVQKVREAYQKIKSIAAEGGLHQKDIDKILDHEGIKKEFLQKASATAQHLSGTLAHILMAQGKSVEEALKEAKQRVKKLSKEQKEKLSRMTTVHIGKDTERYIESLSDKTGTAAGALYGYVKMGILSKDDLALLNEVSAETAQKRLAEAQAQAKTLSIGEKGTRISRMEARKNGDLVLTSETTTVIPKGAAWFQKLVRSREGETGNEVPGW